MTSKTISILAYATIIGWLIGFFGGKDQRDDFARFHLRQGLGLFVVSFIYAIAVQIVSAISLTIGSILGLGGIAFFILMILGMINTSNGVKKPLPIIGNYFVNAFKFI